MTADQLDAIAERLPGFDFCKGREPYQSIKQLFALRNLLAHGKVHATSYVTEGERDGSHFRWDEPWNDYFSREAVLKAREDILSFCQQVVEAAREQGDDEHHRHFFHNAFAGPLGSASGREGRG